ncbi:hypothetical protein Pan44_26170 [Caulifigura coniformis]|uniref:Uncharacterized protein n=1 Tax=Caulifigura coniformis TaxID=2527983 RepID=A0A517SEN8_9PLAN|nr:hypothetical protein [Caulifigura coniformis]QDT54584.1 hypothetical protein Pan44_26170 [Caulifigura coniformis]
MSHQHDHDHDCGHDHDHDHDCGEGGIEVAFELIEGALEPRNLTVDDVNDALMAAIDAREAMVERGESPGEIDEMPLLVGGKSYRCGDIFTVTITDVDDWDDEEEEEEA